MGLNSRRLDMAVIENSVQIDRTPEEVFDYLVDLRNELEWNPGAQSMEKITDGAMGVGTKFLAKWKQSQLVEVECTKFDRPHGWRYVNGGSLSVVLDTAIIPGGDASVLTVRFDVRPNGMLKLFFPLLFQVLKRGEKRNMQYIKGALENK
jgi:carbon monoxide dehydrogenase subunit G